LYLGTEEAALCGFESRQLRSREGSQGDDETKKHAVWSRGGELGLQHRGRLDVKVDRGENVQSGARPLSEQGPFEGSRKGELLSLFVGDT